ncbi:MAG: hypothetical protein GXO90_04875 [FCB group bacterium]|nr:hypothetical protein [FCB group bacterium]
MNRLIYPTVFGLVLLMQPVFGQHVNRLFWDGSDWNRVTKLVDFNPHLEYTVKSAYVNGVLDGRLYYYLKTWAAESGLADSLYGETVDYLTTREVVRSLDEFYKDPANNYLPVPSAIVIANMYARQVPVRVIDNYIKQSRYWINELQIQLELEGNAELLREKQERREPTRLP